MHGPDRLNDARRRRPARTIAIVAALLLVLVCGRRSARANELAPLPPIVDTEGRLGTCYAFYNVGDTMLAPQAYAAGSRWDRFDFRWNVIEGEDTRHGFNFSSHDTIVTRDLDAGIDIVGVLGSTPKWATSSCHVAATTDSWLAPDGSASLLSTDDAYWWRPCPPANLHLSWDHPDNYWGNYVYQTVSHYRGRIHVWELWNEPDIHGVFWSGSPAEFAQLLKVGYQAAKAADPTVTVLFGGLAYWHDRTFYVHVLDALKAMPDAAANNYYFDVMSLHLYSSIYTIDKVSSEIQANMSARVGFHPIWLTETGVPIWDDYDQADDNYKINRATAEEAAAYVIEGFAEARAVGIDRFFHFRTHDDHMTVWNGTAPEYFGLIRDDLSLRPSYIAYQVAAQYLQRENQVTGPFNHGDIRRITFWATPKGRVDVLWAMTGGEPRTYAHPAVVPTATLVTHRGIAQTLQATDGVYTLTLPAATAKTGENGGYIIGGSPLLLIQSDDEIPASSLRPLPEVTRSMAVPLTWDVVDEVSGLWYTEIERSRKPTGPWTRAAGWGTTNGVTTAAVEMPDPGVWYFRARTRDRVGNWEAWPESAETWTHVDVTRTVTLSVTTYVDANANGQWDTDEAAAPPTALTWRYRNGEMIAGTTANTWELTRRVRFDDHVIEATPPDRDYMPTTHAFPVREGDGKPVTITVKLGIRPVRTRLYAPLIFRDP